MSGDLEELYCYYNRRDWASVVSFIEKIPFEEIPFKIKKLYVEALRNIGDFDKANLYETKVSIDSIDPDPNEISKIIFYSGIYEKFNIKDLVNYLIISLGKDNATKWSEFIDLILKRSSENDFKERLSFIDFNNDNCIKHKKVFISGFERSGTGALRDFLNEYDEVYEVPGSEIQVICGRRGIASLY